MRIDYVERKIANAFKRYGQLIALRPLPFIVVPILITVVSATGFFYLDPVTDAIYLFTPFDSPSKLERQSIHEKWPLTDGSFIPGRAVTQAREIQVTAVARKGGNILEAPYSEEVIRLDNFIQNRIRVTFEGKEYGYKQLCLNTIGDVCPGNSHVHILPDLYAHGFNLTFPTVRIGAESGYLGSALGGVSLMRGTNGSQVIAAASSWILLYHLKFYPSTNNYISGLFEKELERAFKEDYPENPYIYITYFHSQTLPDELKRNAESLIPRFVVSFSLLVVFSALCGMSFIGNSFTIDWVLSKPILSILGVLNAGMGILSGVGLLLLIRVPFNDIVAVMPFLVVAVGTDNMFLMVAAIRRTSRAHSVSRRMGECMSEAAVSILITALTDVFSFGVGCITSIPAVQIFCVYTAVAIAITFLFQITFFAALLSIYTAREAERRNSVFLIETKAAEEMKSVSVMQRLFNMGSRAGTSFGDEVPWSTKFFEKWYTPILMHPIVRAVVLLWFVIYLAFAAYGCTQLEEGLEPINLLVEDSYAIPHYRILQDHFWKYGATLQVVVNNAPDLRDAAERGRVLEMAREMCNTTHSAGLDSLQFWMNEMTSYYKTQLEMDLVDAAFYGMVQHFLSTHPSPWVEDVVWTHNATEDFDDVRVSAFRFLVGMRDISSTNAQQEATRVFREVATRYPDYNITTFMPLWLFTDQYAIVVPNTIQNIIIALACMILIALLLIPQPLCAVWVALACASIDFGVMGYMTLWGVKLDAISMITIIMSIGFSVDHSAHITYGYVVSPHVAPRDKIRDSLSALGWPLLQGGLSTILAVSVLADVPAYMIVTFFKTVFLAISIGLLHGIVFLPVFLSIFVRGCCIMKTSTAPHDKVKQTPVASRGRDMMPSPIVGEEGRPSALQLQRLVPSPSIHDKSM